MFSFNLPYFVLLLPLPLFVWWFLPVAADSAAPLDEDSQTALLHPALQRLEKAFSGQYVSPASGHWISLSILILLWISLVLTLMQPQWLRPHTEVKTRGYDLMLAVDLSRSMLALDFTVQGQRVNRLQVVKGVVGRFISQRQGDRIGLIVFGDNAYLQAPLTLDSEVVRKMLDNAEPRIAGDGTAIGDAIGLAVKKLRERPASSRILILLTDGENTAGSLPPEQAALLAAQYQIRIYAIGVGSHGEVPFPDEAGRITMEEMNIDDQLLQKIAEQSGGAYFRATDTQALERIYSDINQLEKTESESRTVLVAEPLFRIPLGLALFMLLALAWLANRRGYLSL